MKDRLKILHRNTNTQNRIHYKVHSL